MSDSYIKELFTLIGMLLILNIWSVYEKVKFNDHCKDAGGVHAGSVCINPAAIIEVN